MESVQNEKSRGWSAGQRSWYNQQQEAMGADLEPGAPAGLGRHRRRPDPALLQRAHLSQGRPGGPPAAPPAGRLALLGGDAPLPDRQRLPPGADRGLRHRLRADGEHATSTGSSTSGATASAIPKVKVTRHWDADVEDAARDRRARPRRSTPPIRSSASRSPSGSSPPTRWCGGRSWSPSSRRLSRCPCRRRRSPSGSTRGPGCSAP